MNCVSAATETKGRVIRPYGMVAAGGMWDVVAYREASESLRVFRAGRIEDAVLLTDRYEMREANWLIRNFVRADSLQTFIDVLTPMLGVNGHPRPELFVADSLHMTPKGYELWRKLIAPVVSLTMNRHAN